MHHLALFIIRQLTSYHTDGHRYAIDDIVVTSKIVIGGRGHAIEQKGKYDANNYEYRIGNKANQCPFADGMRTARLLILPNKVEDQANNGEKEGEHMKACAGAILLLWIGLLAIGVLIVWGVIGLLLALVGLLRARGRCRRGNGSAASRTNNGIVRQRSTTISAIHKYAPFIFQYLNDMKENLFACIIACVKRKFNRISVEQNITC